MKKLWEKGIPTASQVEDFTTAADRIMDLQLAPYDVLGSIAHAKMLLKTGFISADECLQLEKSLRKIMKTIRDGDFEITEGVEDVHSQIEILLTEELGETGKKLHTARSRNDQVLLDLKLFTRDALTETVKLTQQLFNTLIRLSNKNRRILMPGYSHMQVAMPSSFGLWFGAYAESLVDDLTLLLAAYRVTDQNPLGSAAGYGSSFPIDRCYTTELLGFRSLQVNSAYAQMNRTRSEKTVSFALASLANTLSRLSMDICLFSGQNFGFFTLPEEFTTGSSIMPHKKNPDVFELIRARCNKLAALPNEISLITHNLPSGYHRDFQVTKQSFMGAFGEIRECILMTETILEELQINKEIIGDENYDLLFSVEEVNKLVKEGIPFRSAYKLIAEKIENGEYMPDRDLHHTHEGSIGNLCNDMIERKLEAIMYQFNFSKAEIAIKNLVG